MVATTSRVLFIADKVIKQKSLGFDTSCQLMGSFTTLVLEGGCDTVDGSQIPRPTTWDGAKTLKIMGYSLPTSTGFHATFRTNHQEYHD